MERYTKRTYRAKVTEWREEPTPHLAQLGEVDVEVVIDWDKIERLAYTATYTKNGRATAYHGAIVAKMLKGAQEAT